MIENVLCKKHGRKRHGSLGDSSLGNAAHPFHFFDHSFICFLNSIMDAKKLFVVGATLATLGTAAIGIGTSFAASPTAVARPNPMSALVTAIAQKFNLSTTDVQAVFDAQRAQMQATQQADHEARLKTDLASAVQSGKLTQAQADLITAKQAELKALHDSLQGKTPAEVKTALDAERTTLTQWAKDNNIPAQFMRFGLGGPGMGGRGHGPMMGGGAGHMRASLR